MEYYGTLYDFNKLSSGRLKKRENYCGEKLGDCRLMRLDWAYVLIKAQSVYNSIRQSNQLLFMSKQNETVA